MFRTLAIKFYNWLFPVPVTATNSEINTMTQIIQLENGRFALVNRDGVVQDYSRRRDAVRGASRLGLAVA